MTKLAPFYPTDAGRSFVFPKEKHDCSVRAVATCAGGGYKRAHRALRKVGREEGCGIPIASLIHRVPGYHFDRVWIGQKRIGRETLGRFIVHHPVGRYLVRIREHCFAIIDGVVFDDHPHSIRVVITHAWTVCQVRIA